MKKKNLKKQGGFTLIELLIVIGLLGGLTVLILPRLAADREEALGDICDYNNAGTTRVLKQYKQLYGVYPNDLHSGLDAAAAGADPMDGLPSELAANMGQTGTVHALTADQVGSLNAAGIESIAFDTGLNRAPLAEDVTVTRVATGWVDDEGNDYSFDGIPVHGATNSWEAGFTGEADGIVIALFIAPTTNWEGGNGGAGDWTKGNVQYGMDLVGSCPIPTEGINGEPDFAYYMAYFKVYNDATIAARLIGSSCPECGILNP